MTLLEATALETTLTCRIKSLIHQELVDCGVLHTNAENLEMMRKNLELSEENMIRALERMLP